MSKQVETKPVPAYRIFSVTKKNDDESVWFEIGTAWRHKDGKGLNIQFKALALPGAEIVLREPKTKEGDDE